MRQFIFNYMDKTGGNHEDGSIRAPQGKFIQLAAESIWDAITKFKTIYPEAEAMDADLTMTSITEIF